MVKSVRSSCRSTFGASGVTRPCPTEVGNSLVSLAMLESSGTEISRPAALFCIYATFPPDHTADGFGACHRIVSLATEGLLMVQGDPHPVAKYRELGPTSNFPPLYPVRIALLRILLEDSRQTREKPCNCAGLMGFEGLRFTWKELWLPHRQSHYTENKQITYNFQNKYPVYYPVLLRL
jgi:hypothetical protein